MQLNEAKALAYWLALEDLDLPWWDPLAGVLFAVASPYLAAMVALCRSGK